MHVCFHDVGGKSSSSSSVDGWSFGDSVDGDGGAESMTVAGVLTPYVPSSSLLFLSRSR